MPSLLDIWDESPEFEGLLRGLRTGSKDELVVGLQGTSRSFMAAAAAQRLGRPAFFVVPSEVRAEKLKEDLTAFTGQEVLSFSPRPVLPYEVLAESREGEGERLRVLKAFRSGQPFFAVAPIEAVLARMVSPDALGGGILFTPGANFGLGALAEELVAIGYDREERVEAPGQFAIRGGILDLADPAGTAVRVEFFGNEVSSVRSFDPATQRSSTPFQEIRIGPAREAPITREAAVRGLANIRRELALATSRLRRSPEPQRAERLDERLRAQFQAWGDRPSGESAARYLPFFYPDFFLLLDYLPKDALLFVEDPERLKETAEHLHREAAERATALLEEGAILPKQSEALATYHRFEQRANRLQKVSFQLLFRRTATAGLSSVTSMAVRGQEHFAGQWELFRDEMTRRVREGARVALAASTAERAESMVKALRDEGLPARLAMKADLPAPGEVVVFQGEPENGFFLPSLHLWLVTEGEVMGRTKRRRRLQTHEPGERISSFLDLKEGDFVVHVHHGIGRFLGIRTMEVAGQKRDYLHIQYGGEDRLFVPTDQIHLVQKYVGQEGSAPRLFKLGGGDWNRVKSRVKESVREMAAELLRLQAVRRASVGFQCGPDTAWVTQLEESFPYEETPDQLRAMAEIKKDLESGRPMDRLLLGDVGYGKTELALRAAFKMVTEGKQVAVLVPTTILAQQHFQTFTQRTAGFPVEIDLLSRFRTPKEQTETLRRLAEGLTDIVIGTHRLLTKDLRFKDLGLLVIDEEQRFGVQHKERIKSLREKVHVLTLTATPIPRTLQMGLVGMRDMSLIETPPEDRLPVQTYVAEFDPELARDAIQRELGRGGQVYYVHNRVETIDDALIRLRAIVPEARVAVAHGQMREDLLEETMLGFLEGEDDILLSTTIIESGLDISNVNTLVVEGADRLGLGQMYQLRGRIGRSNRQAYAYFTYKRDKSLTEEAEKRLEAIREFTEFGAGFKIAMRDLEIRGAGNILGPEQHGFIVAVGFDLYVQLLEEAVAELSGTPVTEREYPAVDLPVEAYIPDEYIHDERQKIEVYKRIAAVSEIPGADQLLEELADRFGEPPEPVKNLLAIARLRVVGEALGVTAIRMDRTRAIIGFTDLAQLKEERLAAIGPRFRGRALVQTGRVPQIALRVSGQKGEEAISVIEEVLFFLADAPRSA